ncbi:MAG: type II toxin-antitoxin system ParD family antitoxin [Terriglobia bacterium]
MPTRNINLTPQMDSFVDSEIQAGRYANASEVLRAGLRALENAEREDQVKLQALREAIIAGENSGIFEGDIVEDMEEYMKQLAAGKTVA